MIVEPAFLRCGYCRAVNKVPVGRIWDRPKCGKCKSALGFSASAVEITDANFAAEIGDWPGNALVFFWAPWCAHCRSMFPAVNELARQRAGLLKVGSVNTEQAPFLARQFNVMSVPRLMLFRAGRVIADTSGAMRKDQIEGWIDHSVR